MTEINGVFGRVENETLMCFDDLVDTVIVTKVDAHKKLGVWKRKVCEMSRAIFGFFKLFGVHQNDEFGLCRNGSNVFTHT